MTTPAVAPIMFPSLVTLLTQHLSTDPCQAYLNAPVADEVPNPRPARWVALLAVPAGGPQRIVLSTRRVTAQVNDDASKYDTGLLAETVRALFVDAKYQRLGIKRVSIIGEPAAFPGPGLPNRWQLTADFLIRAKASVL